MIQEIFVYIILSATIVYIVRSLYQSLNRIKEITHVVVATDVRCNIHVNKVVKNKVIILKLKYRALGKAFR
jgi:hypothetical protein